MKEKEVAKTKLICPSLKDKTLTPTWNEELEVDLDPNAPFAVGMSAVCRHHDVMTYQIQSCGLQRAK